MTITATLDGIITSCSDSDAQLFQYTPADLVGRVLVALMPGLQLDGVGVLDRVRRGESVGGLAMTGRTRDGDGVPLSVALSPLVDANGTVTGVSVAVHVLDLRAPDPRAWLAAIVESSEDAIVSKTLDGIITSWNGAAEQMFGYRAADAIGRSIRLIVPAERYEEEDRVLARIRRGELVEHFETVRIHKNGARVDVSLTVSPVRDELGNIVGASKIARDIGERKRTEEERARLLREAQEANRAKDQFIAMLGHELRNPLGAIMSALQILQRVGANEPAAAHARAVATRQGWHLAKLVDDLLDVGRVLAGKIVIDPRPLDLGQIVRSYVATLRSQGKLDRHDVSIAAASVTVSADPVRLEQIIANLLGNALRYTPPGGHIRVSVEASDSQAVFAVEDDGIGIAPELLPRIFDVFVQSERRLDRAAGGLGIGLTLVKRLAELHGGSVEATSEGAGRGSRFVVRMPALPAYVAVSEPPSELEIQATRARRILVVEDNDDAREMLRHLLQQDGHEVFEAADGRSGVQAALRHRPDIALLDIGLPELDGYEVAREIRTQMGRTWCSSRSRATGRTTIGPVRSRPASTCTCASPSTFASS